ncbi:MAG: ubiquinone biosynthesis protein UbiE [Deltaproteobacteria bacterium]|nr:ubiquinone biosynthesis protein UbiE [Deltaproteobacteria bacterium]
MPSEAEDRITRFHAHHPGITSRGLARGGSYERLADLVPPGARVLDLGCGDGHLVELLARRGCFALGVDLSGPELALATSRPGAFLRARAQCLPVADRSLEAVVCHLAFMLLDDVERVVGELARVLVPGGRFAAVLGGGPTATGDDAFHRLLRILAPRLRDPVRFGDRRARSEAGWRALFAGWSGLAFERAELDLSGSFDDVWAVLCASYELDGLDLVAIREELRASVGTGWVRCQMVIWFAVVTAP